MADENTGVTDAPVTQEDGSGVAESGSGNWSEADLAGLLAQSYGTEESEAVANEGEGEAEQQDTSAEPETEVASVAEEEAEDEPDTADAEDGEDDEDVLSQLSEHAAKKARKRIGQLTARAKSAEEALEARNEQLEQLQSRLEALEKSKSDEQPENANRSFIEKVSSAETPQELQKLRDIAQQTKRFCRENLHKEYVELGKDENGEPRVIDHDELVQMLNDAEDVLEKEIPNRVKFLKNRATVAQNALNDFPAWKDKEHPDHRRLLELWNDPVGKSMFHNQPNGVYLAGVMLEGIKAMEAKRSAQGKPAEQAQEKPKQTQQRVAPKVPGMESTSPPSKQVSDFEKNFHSKQSLSTDDLVSYFAAKAKGNK